MVYEYVTLAVQTVVAGHIPVYLQPGLRLEFFGTLHRLMNLGANLTHSYARLRKFKKQTHDAAPTIPSGAAACAFNRVVYRDSIGGSCCL